MLSNYGAYIYEREGKSIIEHDYGFVTYIAWPKLDAVYMEHIYIAPAFRKQGKTKELVQEVCQIAKSQGYKFLVGSVAPSANNSTGSLAGMLAHGFKLDSAENNLIWFKKEVG